MDFGLESNWDWSLGGLERVVEVRGWSCSDKDKDGFFLLLLSFFFLLFLLLGSAKSGGDFGGDLVDLQERLNLLVEICLNGEVKKMGLLVSEEFTVKWTAEVAAIRLIERVLFFRRTGNLNLL